MANTPHEISILLLDKVLLGAVALVVAHYLNRKLEVFRSRRAVESEFLRERTKRLDELFGLMLDVEAAGTKYVGHALGYIEARKARKGFLSVTSPPPEVATSYKAYRDLSLNAASVGELPWIGDSLAALCAEYEKVVEGSVVEQTVAGSHDVDQIDRLGIRTTELQNAIVEAIRVGVPPAPTPTRP